jgi:hypothetical protein
MVVDYDTEAIDDFVTPDYSRKIADGAIINNPCSYVRSLRKTSGEGYDVWEPNVGGNQFSVRGAGYTQKRYLQSLSNSAAPVKDLAAGFEPASVSRAKLKALSNIDSTPYAFGEDALEIRETLKFLKSPVSSMKDLAYSYFKAKKRLTKKSAMSAAKASANAWAQYHWAFSPLLRSVSDAVEASIHFTRYEPPRLTSRGFTESSHSDTVVNEDYPKIVDPASGNTFTRSYERTQAIHASILYQVSNPVRDLKWRLGFRAKDLPHTLWQVLPLSFVVDRLIDVSKSIEALTNLADPEVNILAASVVTRDHIIEDIQMTNAYSSNHTLVEFYGDLQTDETFSYNRVKWRPSVSDAIPSVTPEVLVKDAQSIVDIIALTLQRLR